MEGVFDQLQLNILDTFTDLHIRDFSSLFEIAATLNLIYVIADNAKQYGNILTEYFFQYRTNIKSVFDERYKENIALITIDNCPDEKTQQVTRDIQKLKSIKDEKIKKLNDKIEKCSVLSSFSYISLYMFFYSMFALFVCGLNETLFLKFCWSIITILSYIVLVWVCFTGERDKTQVRKESFFLFRSCFLFIFVLHFSFSCYLFSRHYIHEGPFFHNLWTFIVFVGALLPYLGFLIYMLIIQNRLKALSKDMAIELDSFDKECKEVEAQINHIKDVHDLSVSRIS